MKEERFLNFLKIISVENRFRIIKLLSKERLCVNALSMRLDITSAAVSQHLRVLKDNGILRSEKVGYYMHYTVDKELMSEIRDNISEHLNF